MKLSDADSFSWIELPAFRENLPRFSQFIQKSAKTEGFSEAVVQKIDLILEEVLVNIINYAYPDQPEGLIQAGCKTENNSFIIKIIDHGLPFDPSARPDPDTSLSIEDRQIGGLGIFLVRQLSHDVSYQRIKDQNHLEIVLKE
ncbi:MAG: ATP-binding protein [Desulfonatronovibrionaceae bacterium]